MRLRLVIAGIAALAIAPPALAHADRARISVVPASSLADEPVHIQIAGLPRRATVKVQLRVRDARGKVWRSSAFFRANRRGSIDLDRVPGRYNGYTGRWGTGLLATLDRDVRTLALFKWKKAGGHVFRVDVRLGTKRLAATSFRRATPSLRDQGESLAATGFLGRYYTRGGAPVRAPGVVLLGGSEGGVPSGPLAKAIAARGYPTLALGYFGAPGLPPTLANIPLEYFEHALRWLRERPEVDPGHTIVVGISRGSEAAQLLGIHYPDLVSAVVAGVPSNVAICGFPDCSFPAWTFEEQPVPYTMEFNNPYPADNPNAALADELVRGPLFLVCGGVDSVWLSCWYQQAIRARLASYGHPYPDVARAYPHAGHAVGALLPYLIVAPHNEYVRASDERAREAVWPRLLAFLGSLRSG